MIRFYIAIFILIFINSCSLKQDSTLDSTFVESNIKSSQTNIDSNKDSTKLDSTLKNEIVKVKLSFVGDIVLGDYKGATGATFNAKFKEVKGDYSYFSKVVAKIFSEDDLSIGNLEGVLTDKNLPTAFKKPFSFKGKSIYTNILKSSNIESVNIANNHTRDYGMEGFKDTKKNLENAKINYFGEGNLSIVEIKGKKFGFAGHRGWNLNVKKQVKNDITRLKHLGADIVIFTFHFGEERKHIPNKIQIELAHFAIDNGASLVIGHHPHVLQSIEEYKGKKIIYSLGNFIYGGAKNPSDKDSMIYQVEFIFHTKDLRITPQTDYITNLNAIDSLDTNTTLVHNIIPVSISSNDNFNDYSPRIYEKNSKEYKRVFNRLEEYSKTLQINN